MSWNYLDGVVSRTIIWRYAAPNPRSRRRNQVDTKFIERIWKTRKRCSRLSMLDFDAADGACVEQNAANTCRDYALLLEKKETSTKNSLCVSTETHRWLTTKYFSCTSARNATLRSRRLQVSPTRVSKKGQTSICTVQSTKRQMWKGIVPKIKKITIRQPKDECRRKAISLVEMSESEPEVDQIEFLVKASKSDGYQ